MMQIAKERIKLELLIHDLKVPLAVIETGVKALLDRKDTYGPLTKRQERVLERTLRNVKVTRTLVNDALELGRSAQGVSTKKECILAEFVEQSFVEIFDLLDHPMAERIGGCVSLKGLQETLLEKAIRLEIEDGLWTQKLCLDEDKVRQILRNLLNNALKFRREKVELKVERYEGQLLIALTDDGEGIPAAFHQKIFDCYFQLGMQGEQCVRGHGLGLAGVMVLVEDMGGMMSLRSDTAQGTTFLVKLPC
jgi:two-component system OmpR family sensor kinase